MKPIPLLACAVLITAATAPFAQAARPDAAREQRIDSAYQNWQKHQGAPVTGLKSGGRSVTGEATPDDGSRPGWTTGSAKGDLKATGSAVKQAARSTGHAVAEGGRKVGRGAKKAASKVKSAVTPDTAKP